MGWGSWFGAQEAQEDAVNETHAPPEAPPQRRFQDSLSDMQRRYDRQERCRHPHTIDDFPNPTFSHWRGKGNDHVKKRREKEAGWMERSRMWVGLSPDDSSYDIVIMYVCAIILIYIVTALIPMLWRAVKSIYTSVNKPKLSQAQIAAHLEDVHLSLTLQQQAGQVLEEPQRHHLTAIAQNHMKVAMQNLAS